MRVPVQTSLGIAVILIVAGEVPDDERLVATAGEEHVRAARQISDQPIELSIEAGQSPRTFPTRLPDWSPSHYDPRGSHASPIAPPCWASGRFEIGGSGASQRQAGGSCLLVGYLQQKSRGRATGRDRRQALGLALVMGKARKP